MKLTHVVLHRLQMPMVSPFRTSYGVETNRNALLVQLLGSDFEGWGECVAQDEPLYTAEYSEGAQHVISKYLLPRLANVNVVSAELSALFAPVVGNPMAKAGIEAAMLDAECRHSGVSLAKRLGAVHSRVPSGVAVGLHDSVAALLKTVEMYLAQGYKRIKLKIEPGRDIDCIGAVRKTFGNDLMLQVDANGAYTINDADHLARLDDFDLLFIEQPFAEDNLLDHAELVGKIRTRVCLDESIVSLQSARLAIAMRACHVINIKPGRVGGFLEAVKIHDLCVREGVPVWCGGMLETGIGRAGNLALAGLPGFTLPGDLSASSRYFHRDVTDAFELNDGYLHVPDGLGIGVRPDADALKAFTVSTQTVRF
jgi:o-succinylbenzoate synthase